MQPCTHLQSRMNLPQANSRTPVRWVTSTWKMVILIGTTVVTYLVTCRAYQSMIIQNIMTRGRNHRTMMAGKKHRESAVRVVRRVLGSPVESPSLENRQLYVPSQSIIRLRCADIFRQKRKAQNRAAQRAFRERKERHLKDLETKVEDLEKASEATNHENGRLRAEVERLNTEVKEYRKRMSLTAPATGRSPPTASPTSYNSYQNQNNDFMFAFPKFGDLPATFMNNGSLAKASPPARQASQSSRASNSIMQQSARASVSQSPTTRSPTNFNDRGSPMNFSTASPTNLNGVSASTSSSGPYQSPKNVSSGDGLEELNGLFSPSILETARRSRSEDYMFPSTITGPKKSSSTDSYRALANTPSLGRNGSTSSPSASSMSHGGGLDSSCGTTPEPSADSPEYRKSSEGALNTISEETISKIPKYSPGKTSSGAHGLEFRIASSTPFLNPIRN